MTVSASAVGSLVSVVSGDWAVLGLAGVVVEGSVVGGVVLVGEVVGCVTGSG